LIPNDVDVSLPSDITFNFLECIIKRIATTITIGMTTGKYAGSALLTEPNNLACKTSNSEGDKTLLINVDTEFKPPPIMIPTNSINCRLPYLPDSSQPYKMRLMRIIKATCKRKGPVPVKLTKAPAPKKNIMLV